LNNSSYKIYYYIPLVQGWAVEPNSPVRQREKVLSG
jgi:hypothetical protein